MDPQLLEAYRDAIDRGLADGSLMTREQIADTLKAFQDKFSPAKLAELDGAALLEKLHARNVEAKCLMYWLEFKDDDEFRGGRMGSIGGGSAVCQLPLRQGALKTIMDKCTRRRDWPTSTARRCL